MTERNYDTDPEVIVAPITINVFQQLTTEMRLELISTLQSMDQEISDALSDSISDFSVEVVGELIAVPFGIDGLAGDSGWEGSLTQPYTNQTFNELRDNMVNVLQKEWKMDSAENAEMEWEDMYADELMGYWIIPKSIYNTFGMPDCGSDSATYAAIRAFKTFIQKNAIVTLLNG